MIDRTLLLSAGTTAVSRTSDGTANERLGAMFNVDGAERLEYVGSSSDPHEYQKRSYVSLGYLHAKVSYGGFSVVTCDLPRSYSIILRSYTLILEVMKV